MFPLPELQFKADGMVPNTHIKKHRAQCHDCAKKIPIDETTMKDRLPPDMQEAVDVVAKKLADTIDDDLLEAVTKEYPF